MYLHTRIPSFSVSIFDMYSEAKSCSCYQDRLNCVAFASELLISVIVRWGGFIVAFIQFRRVSDARYVTFIANSQISGVYLPMFIFLYFYQCKLVLLNNLYITLIY